MLFSAAAGSVRAATGTLSNEHLVNGSATDPHAFCDSSFGLDTITWSVSGTASGPYGGTFTESGTARLGLYSGSYAPIADLSSTFTITTADGTITGSTSWVSGTSTGTGRCDLSGEILRQVDGLHYTATLPDGSTDEGTTKLSFYDTSAIGSFDQTFTSTAPTLPSLTVADAPAAEGGSAVFTVSLSSASGSDVSVDYATADGTATAGEDYAAASGTLTFAAGETAKTVTVQTTGDTAVEGDETFELRLSSASGATISRGTATGTIVDDDSAPANAAPTASFTASASGDSVSVDAAASSDPDGDALAYAWDFGDGATGSGVSTAHVYAAAGDYTVTLTVSDGRGGTATATRTIALAPANRAPTAAFSFAPASPRKGAAVTFDGTASSDPDGDALVYAWDFGDGTTGSGSPAAHAFATPGSFTVTLTVTDPSGAADATSATIAVAAPAPPPISGSTPATPNRRPHASFTVQAVAGLAEDVELDASGSSDPDADALTYAWDFGDGTNGTGVAVTHAYLTAGAKVVRLTVTDPSGAGATATHVVQVSTTLVIEERIGVADGPLLVPAVQIRVDEQIAAGDVATAEPALWLLVHEVIGVADVVPLFPPPPTNP